MSNDVTSEAEPNNDIPNAAYRWAAGFYGLFILYAWYLFWELGIFIAQHYLPENASGYSLSNPNFSTINGFVSAGLAIVVGVILIANEKLKNYIVDVGDEMCRISWADLKETQKSTIVVIALATISALFMFVADQIFLRIVNFLLKFAIEF